MTTAIVTTKGQIVIPSAIRKEMHIKKGTKFCIVQEEDRIILQPLTSDYFEKMAGIAKIKGKNLLKDFLEERAYEKQLEDRK